MMDNAEEVLQLLEDFSKRKPRFIPPELNEYLAYVARTGDPVYQWSLVKNLFKEKLMNVITDFYETSPGIDIPPCPNVDPFNYDVMKNCLLERLDFFSSAPFTIQRICELLIYPRKQYNRIDKFMRAVEKNILVVSTREPGPQTPHDAENGETGEPLVNGSDNNSDYSVDVEMEDMSCKEGNAHKKICLEPQPGSSDSQITVDIESQPLTDKLSSKEDESNKKAVEGETTNIEKQTVESENPNDDSDIKDAPQPSSSEKIIPLKDMEKSDTLSETKEEQNIMDTDIPTDTGTGSPSQSFMTPGNVVDDSEMTESKVIENSAEQASQSKELENKIKIDDNPISEDDQSVSPVSTDENSCSSTKSDLVDSDESTSETNQVTDGENSNSEKSSSSTSEENTDIVEKDNTTKKEDNDTMTAVEEEDKEVDKSIEPLPETHAEKPKTEEYSIKDVNSEIPQENQEVSVQPADKVEIADGKEPDTTLSEESVVPESKMDSADLEQSKENEEE